MMSLRKRNMELSSKIIEESESEDELESEEDNGLSDSEWKEDETVVIKPGRPRKRIVSPSKVSNEYISEYERIRLANIEERNQMLMSMGINVDKISSINPPADTSKLKRVRKEKLNSPVRISQRLKGKPSLKYYDDEGQEIINEIDSRNLGRWAKGRQIFGERAYEDVKCRTGRPSVVPRKYFE